MERFDAEAARRRLRRAWSAATSGKWREDAPALGQCSVTALLLHDRYGAELLSTPTPWGPHFYNRFGGERLDLTAEQFAPSAPPFPPTAIGRRAGTRRWPTRLRTGTPRWPRPSTPCRPDPSAVRLLAAGADRI